jgi:hypothetical protein
MQGRSEQLSGGQELSQISQKDFNNGSLLQRIIDAVNTLARNVGSAAVGKMPPPHPIQSITVQGTQNNSTNTLVAPSEILHWTLNHTQEVDKHVNYFSEIDTNPAFTAPHVIHHGASRTGFLSLPTQDNTGKVQTYYLRSYPQYLGSDAQKPTVFGGLAQPLKIQMTGSSKTTLLTSTGSGTAAANGSQGGKGFGTDLTRPVPGPKRNLLS